MINVILTIMAAYPLSRKDFYGRNSLWHFCLYDFFSGGSYSYIPAYSKPWHDRHVLGHGHSKCSCSMEYYYYEDIFPVDDTEEIRESAMLDGCGNIGNL